MGDAIARGGIYDTESPSGDRLRCPVVSHASGGGWPAVPAGATHKVRQLESGTRPLSRNQGLG